MTSFEKHRIVRIMRLLRHYAAIARLYNDQHRDQPIEDLSSGYRVWKNDGKIEAYTIAVAELQALLRSPGPIGPEADELPDC